jgi:hypothetical protein
MSIRILAAALCVSSICAIAQSGVIVVDASNGPGTDFTSLKAALAAAANGDIVLMRSGVYDGFHVISGKSVSVVADAGATVTIKNSDMASFVTASLQVVGAIPGPVLIQGCRIESSLLTASTPASGALRIATTGTVGDVFIDSCVAEAEVGSAIEAVGTSRTTITQCEGHGGDSHILLPGTFPAGLGLFLASTAATAPTSVFASAFFGGNGMVQDPLSSSLLLSGGAGIRSTTLNSVRNKLISGTIAQGGDGSDATLGGPTCVAPGSGGHGVEVIAGFGPYYVDGSFAGGSAGIDPTPCASSASNGLPEGVTFLGLPGVHLAAQPSRVVSHAPVREGDAVTLSIEGPLNHAAFAVIGFSPTHVIAPELAGSLVVNPNTIVALGSMPPAGSITLSTHAPTMPVGVEAGIVYLQPITQDMTSGQATLGAPSALVILDQSL